MSIEGSEEPVEEGEVSDLPEPDPANPAALPLEPKIERPSEAQATGTLWALLALHPYHELHLRWDGIPLKGTAKVSYAAEFILVTVILTILIGTASIGVWKALAPIPHW